MAAAAIFARQHELGTRIQQMLSTFKTDASSLKTADYAAKRLSCLSTLWEEFNRNHEKLLKDVENNDEELEYFKDNYYDSVFNTHKEFLSRLNELIGTVTIRPSSTVPSKSADGLAQKSQQQTPSKSPNQLPTQITQPLADSLLRLQRKRKSLQQAVTHYLENIAKDNEQSQSPQYYQLKIDRLLSYEKELKEIQNLECLLSLKNLDIGVDHWDPILLHVLLKKLDRSTLTLYEQGLENPKEFGTMSQFMEFLESRFLTLEAVQRGSLKKYDHSNALKSKSFPAISSRLCPCDSQVHHQLYKCTVFLSWQPDQRAQFLKKESRCLNCMKPGHFASQCTSRACLKCNKRHNTLIHGQESKTIQPLSSSLSSNDVTASLSIHTEHPKSGFVLLGTVGVRIQTSDGNEILCRALLDSGSQINVISERVAKQLGSKYKRSNMTIEGIGNSVSSATHRVNIFLKSINTDFSIRMDAFVLPKITGDQPIKSFNTKAWPIPQHFTLADPQFNEPSRIDLLIGAEYYYRLLQPEQYSMGPNLPLLQNSSFGWILAGMIADLQPNNRPICNVATHGDEGADLAQSLERFCKMEELPNMESQPQSNDWSLCGVGTQTDEAAQIDRLIERLWKLEDYSNTNSFTEEEEQCERDFKKNTIRDPSGRFTVRLPFVRPPTDLGESADTASRRFFALERRLAGNPEIKRQYTEFIEEYIDLGHMKPIDVKQLKHPYYFLPHHYVCKPDSSTTKLRVVFDASALTSNNISLNDVLAKGPVVQDELFSILLRFRTHSYVFITDIKQMFRQIGIHEDDQRYLLIFWRNNPHEELRAYQLTTVTYGTKSAPYLATKCLQTLADERSEQYPRGSSVLRNDAYVDDIITGTNSLSEAVHTQTELIALASEGGFYLRKWCSNHPRLLKGFSSQDMEIDLDFDTDSEDRIKTLGLTWCPKQDVFSVQSSCPERKTINKRSAYSDLARIFDPLGIYSPIVVSGKILVQDMWKLKSHWDEELPLPLKADWVKFRENLSGLKELTFSRHLFDHKTPNEIQLHTFADASEKAYGAAVYVRATFNDTLTVRLLCAKSRVAPTQKETIPKLELCAAKLAADLCHKVKSSIDLSICKEFYWTDSSIVLAWLNRPSSSKRSFVANRVAAIQRKTAISNWRHVTSEDNPADIISRGTTPQRLKSLSIWFYGPLFLHGSEELFPPRYELESTTALSITLSESLRETIRQIDHHNSFKRLQRIMAYILRFTKRIQGIHNHHEYLTAEEMNDALHSLIRYMQQEEFSDDIACLNQHDEVPKGSPLNGLAPFIDEYGIVRVGGRLQEANVSYNAKHPMLLPYRHPFTKLLMTDIHLRHKHAPPQTLLSITRQSFWPIKGKIIARSIVHHCIHCTRLAPKLMNQMMGNLPAPRVQAARPFINTGVDYCGPFWTHFKIRGKKPVKSYVAIFCCFATKALHLELVSDLSTSAFLGALRRFISRRGHCLNIYSDNATNFVGASNQLNEIYDAIYSKNAQSEISSVCANKGITFHFIPPRAPHFGGLWEAAVKSTKRLMQLQISSASLTYEELETLIIEIEAILNSRPITPMSADPSDLTALTPGHFLIGEPLTSNVDPQAQGRNISLDARWQLVRQLKNDFWEKWTIEYLHGLQERQKWKTSHSNIEPNTLVMIHEDNAPSLKWPLGRVVDTIKGKDGRVRVIKIKTASQVIERPIHKVAPLPIEVIDDTMQPNQREASKRIRFDSKAADNCEASQHPKHRRLFD